MNRCWNCLQAIRTIDRRVRRYCGARCARRFERVRNRYGLSSEQYRDMVALQADACGLCGRRGTLGVDHDHETGRVRWLLCNDCNLGLGRFRDDPQLLRRAAAYVEHFREVS